MYFKKNTIKFEIDKFLELFKNKNHLRFKEKTTNLRIFRLALKLNSLLPAHKSLKNIFIKLQTSK